MKKPIYREIAGLHRHLPLLDIKDVYIAELTKYTDFVEGVYLGVIDELSKLAGVYKNDDDVTISVEVDLEALSVSVFMLYEDEKYGVDKTNLTRVLADIKSGELKSVIDENRKLKRVISNEAESNILEIKEQIEALEGEELEALLTALKFTRDDTGRLRVT